MSTNPKDLNPKESSEATIRGSKRSVDASLRNLQKEMEQENTLVLETPLGRLQRVLKIYRGIKPLLSVLSTLPLIPTTWRAAIVMFHQALEAMAASTPDISAEFKAGKDI
ncbi:MAG TPA: hypothetical protein VKB93_15330 [Thermoanaerobaculia bacterium]|nr:hypothetical protein [Thermoanaerobaculia bacterium]